jgi:hypothetical protein
LYFYARVFTLLFYTKKITYMPICSLGSGSDQRCGSDRIRIRNTAQYTAIISVGHFTLKPPQLKKNLRYGQRSIFFLQNVFTVSTLYFFFFVTGHFKHSFITMVITFIRQSFVSTLAIEEMVSSRRLFTTYVTTLLTMLMVLTFIRQISYPLYITIDEMHCPKRK